MSGYVISSKSLSVITNCFYNWLMKTGFLKDFEKRKDKFNVEDLFDMLACENPKTKNLFGKYSYFGDDRVSDTQKYKLILSYLFSANDDFDNGLYALLVECLNFYSRKIVEDTEDFTNAFWDCY